MLAVTVSLLTSCGGDGGPEGVGGSKADATTDTQSTDAVPGAPGTTDAGPATTGSPTVTTPPGGGQPAAPSILSPADDGASYAMAIDTVVDLVVPGVSVPDLVVEGTSVEVVDTMNIDDSGQRQWELRAVAGGTTVIRGGGAVPFTLTLTVSS